MTSDAEAKGDGAAGPGRRYAARDRRPSQPAVEALEFCSFFSRFGAGLLCIRHSFLWTPAAPGSKPPIRQLFDGGQGNDLAVKMLLALWWSLRDFPYTWDVPEVKSEGWGLLCGRPPAVDPTTDRSTSRAVARAIDRLSGLDDDSPSYIDAIRARGRSAVLMLRDYTHPTDHMVRSGDGISLAPEHRYCRVPSTLITNGWMAVLPGKALLVLLALIDHLDVGDTKMVKRSSGDRSWEDIGSYRWAPIGPQQYERRYGFGKDAWFDGLRLLRLWGLVAQDTKLQSPVPGLRRRPTSVVTVRVDQLEKSPIDVYEEALERFRVESHRPPDPLNRGGNKKVNAAASNPGGST